MNAAERAIIQRVMTRLSVIARHMETVKYQANDWQAETAADDAQEEARAAARDLRGLPQAAE